MRVMHQADIARAGFYTFFPCTLLCQLQDTFCRTCWSFLICTPAIGRFAERNFSKPASASDIEDIARSQTPTLISFSMVPAGHAFQNEINGVRMRTSREARTLETLTVLSEAEERLQSLHAHF